MRTLNRVSILVVALAMAPSPAFSQAAPSDGPAQESSVVPLYVSTNRPLAMLTIGDRSPLPVVFDTGTDDNILDAAYAKEVGLKTVGRSTIIDAASGRSTEVPVVDTPKARLSGLPLTSTTAQLLDYRGGDERGIFGPGSFAGNYVIVEAGLNRLRIVPKDSGFAPSGPGQAYENGLPTVDIDVGGRRVRAHIDSGNDSALILGAELIKTVPLKSPAQVVAIARSALGEREVLGGQLAASVSVGSYRLDEPDVTFSLKGSGGNVGFPVIRHLTIILDPAAKRSWVLDPASEKSAWSDFTGQFGPRTIRLNGSELIHQREGRPEFAMKYLGGDLFEMPATGDRIQFFRKDGRVMRLELITVEGSVIPAERVN